MYYLLKLEVNYKIPKGAIVVSQYKIQGFGKPFVTFDSNEIEHDFSGKLWDGKKVFDKISKKYNLGDTLETDIYDIAYTIMSAGDDWELADNVYSEINDLLEDDLLGQWTDLEKPIVFLMQIIGVSTWTDCGKEWDIEQQSIKVITHNDLVKLAENE